MSDSEPHPLVFIVLPIIISIFSGYLAWNWIEPKSFLGAIGFLIIWGVLTKIGHFIVGLIFMK